MSTVVSERNLDIRRTWLHYGWVNVVVAAVAMTATFPGRTQGLGFFTESIRRDLDLSRTFYGSLNLWATVIGALFCLPIGGLVDRFGSRGVLTAIYVAFGAVVLWMGHVADWPDFFACLILTRGLGQSALSVVSITLVAKWFRGPSQGWAMAVYAILMGLGFSLVYLLVGGALRAEWGWREIWVDMGWALLAGLAPLSLLRTRSTPNPTQPSQHAADSPEPLAEGTLEGATLRAALRTPAFWVFSLSVSFYGLVQSGISLFNEEIFKDNNIPREVYYNAVPIAVVTGVISKLLAAWLAGSCAINRLLALSTGILMVALLALPLVENAWQAYLYSIVMGISGGVIALVFFAIWGQTFGRREVGRIQGIAQMLTVLASAIGAWLFPACRDYCGSYLPVFSALAPVAFALAIACWWTPLPKQTW
jgi:MFS family permease